jgi:putative tricarboxylic transport membrane protein
MFENMLTGLIYTFRWDMLFAVFVGVVGGIVVGVLPGLSTTMGVALLIPVTFGMPPAVGLAMLGGMYAASVYSGSISAILLNIPGTSSACATLIDGHPMALKGEGGRAIALATIASSVGGNVSNLCLLFMAPPLAFLALKFGALEYFLVAMFGITIIASVSEKDLVKGLISGILGLFVSMIGTHQLTGLQRFTFGIPALYDGMNVVVAMIGLYSLPEVIDMIQKQGGEERRVKVRVRGGLFRQMFEYFHYKYVIFRSLVIGVIIGIAPGAGGCLAGFVAYYDAKRTSKHPELFGTGVPEGVLSCETANNAEMGGALIPTLTLGVPGSAVCAVFLGGLMIHGLRPGPQLFTQNPEVIYGFIFSIFLSNLFFVPLGLLTARYGSRLIEMPVAILAPTIVTLAVIGTFAINGSIEDTWLMLIMGLVGYIMNRCGVPREGMVLGLVLGSMAESELARAIMLVHGDVAQLLIQAVTRPIALILVILCLFSLGNAVRMQYIAKKAPILPVLEK